MPNLPPGMYGASILWTLIALAGFIIGFYSVMEAHRDAIALERTRKNGYRKLIASAAVWTEVIRMTVYALFMSAGVLSFFGPGPRDPHNPIAYMLVVAVTLNVINSANGLRLRRILLREN